jgi:hypothetical protein
MSKDVQIQRSRGQGGSSTVTTTKRTVIKTGVGERPKEDGNSTSIPGGTITSTAATLLTNNTNTTTNSNAGRQIILTSNNTKEPAASPPSRLGGFFGRFRK